MFQFTILKLSLLIQMCMLNRSFPHEVQVADAVHGLFQVGPRIAVPRLNSPWEVPKLMFPDNGDLARNWAMETGEMMYAQLCSTQFTIPETNKPLKCLAADQVVTGWKLNILQL